MRKTIKQKLKEILSEYSGGASFDVLTPPSAEMGDYSTNMAFRLSGKPMEIAKDLKAKIEINADFQEAYGKIIILEPGFINFKLRDDLLSNIVSKILKERDKFGDLQIEKEKINLEFVSANPTGPLTVGNVRAAAYGDTLGNILKKAGYKVFKEYYINDVGVQVKKLAESIELRIKELRGEKVKIGEDMYKGEYIKDLADEYIKQGSSTPIGQWAVEQMIEKARQTMSNLGIQFDSWFRESDLHTSGEVKSVLEHLESKGHVVEEEGAKWLKVNEEQKAVLVKSDGSTTYLMNDIAYTKNKLEKGFDKAINIWGTDHHGDVPRLKAGVAALGYDPSRLEILLHQLVTIKNKDEKIKISKRAGNIFLLDDLLNDVGKDAVRFFFLTKDLNTHMEFDVELAKEQSKKNPVYYIQYAFARLNSIFEKAGNDVEGADLTKLNSQEEKLLMRTLAKFPDIIEGIANDYQVHHLANYALELANQFHQFYEKHRVINNDMNLQKSRLALSQAIHAILENCLNLMGISTPSRMRFEDKTG